MVAIFFLYFLYATIFVIGKFAIGVAEPIFLTGVRMVVAGILSYMIHCAWYRCSQFSLLNRKDWLAIWCLALFNVYITNAGEFWSLQYLSAGKVSFIYNLSPFFVLLFSALFFTESITWKKIVGMIIAFISLMPMLMGSSDTVDTTMHFEIPFAGFLSVAEIVMLCSAAATALGWVSMRYLIGKQTLTPYFLNGISMVLGGLLCLAHSFLFESQPFITSGSMQSFMYYMLSMMLIQNVFAYNLHTYLLKVHTATLIALFSFVMPLMTIFMSHLFLEEPITMLFFICSAGVALGLFVFYQEELRI